MQLQYELFKNLDETVSSTIRLDVWGYVWKDSAEIKFLIQGEIKDGQDNQTK